MRAFGALLKQVADILRNDAQYGRLQCPFNVINGFHARIKIFDEKRQTNANHQADNDSQRNIERLVGAHRTKAGLGPVNDFHHGGLGHDHLHVLLGHAQVENLPEPFDSVKIGFGHVIRTAFLSDLSILELGLLQSVFRFIHDGLQAFDASLHRRHDAAHPVVDF